MRVAVRVGGMHDVSSFGDSQRRHGTTQGEGESQSPLGHPAERVGSRWSRSIRAYALARSRIPHATNSVPPAQPPELRGFISGAPVTVTQYYPRCYIPVLSSGYLFWTRSVQPRVRERGAATGQRAVYFSSTRRSINSGYDTIERR